MDCTPEKHKKLIRYIDKADRYEKNVKKREKEEEEAQKSKAPTYPRNEEKDHKRLCRH